MLAIIAAFKEEIREYLKIGQFKATDSEGHLSAYLSKSLLDVVVILGGFGKNASQEATELAIEKYRAKAIVSPGFAGGAKPGLASGELFVCDKLMTLEGPAAFWKPESASERFVGDSAISWVGLDNEELYRDCTFGACMSLTQFVSSSSMKEWIGSTFDVSVIDMESYWVGEIALQHGLPHLIVRSILDPMEQTVPEFVAENLSEKGNRMVRKAIRYVAAKPFQMPKLLHLASQSKTASASLSDFLVKMTLESSRALNLAVDSAG